MKIIALVLTLCMLLSGCSALTDGEYVWQETHHIEASPGGGQDISAGSYNQLYRALCNLVESGTEQGTIIVDTYIQDRLPTDIQRAVAEVKQKDPIAAYAVGEITCDIGTSGNKPALSVQIVYIHDRFEIRRIKHVEDNAQAWDAIAAALRNFDAGIVLLVESYQEADLLQWVEDYGMDYPQYVMEQPQAVVNLYPETGESRVLEMRFSYQTSRDSLKNMRSYVQTLFSSAMGYVSGDTADAEKLDQLYGFLMARFGDKIETAITPAYHLLYHGVGDSKAFATVYAAMCRQAGLQCQVVYGTRQAEPWFWNIVQIDGVYYHVDLLRCHELGDYQTRSDVQMEGYVWDYEAYPVCGVTEEPESGEEKP